MMSRRTLLAAIGTGALSSFASFAQQGKVWRVGLLYVLSRQVAEDRIKSFKDGMRELGYHEGKNLILESRFADGQIERLPSLAAELIGAGVDVIVTAGSPATRAAQQATSTVPIVMANGNDPVREGFVKSLRQPGGNITGLSNIATDLSAKHLEMLAAMVPKLTRVAVLSNPANASHADLIKTVQAGAVKTNKTIVLVEVHGVADLESAFAAIVKAKAGAIIVLPDGLFTTQREQMGRLALKHRLPSISVFGNYAEAGVLMSYGGNANEQVRRAATYVDKIFKGGNPAKLAVEQSTKFELIINAGTAKKLGLKIPQSLLISADRVIE